MIVLKHLPDIVVKEYTILFNNCFDQSYYLVRWKKAKIIPIKKKGKESSDPSEYMPISLTMNISKIFEKLIKKQILDYAEPNNIIPDNQFGFRAKHSTVHAIHKFLSDVNNYLLNGKLVGTVLLDLEKDFGSVWLNVSIYILILLEFPLTLILLISDMIHGKTFVTWDGFNLSTIVSTILEGMQPGTALILFIIYTHKILNLFNLRIIIIHIQAHMQTIPYFMWQTAKYRSYNKNLILYSTKYINITNYGTSRSTRSKAKLFYSEKK